VRFVLDSSVALSWCFEDERTPATQALLERVVESGAVVPVLWPLEVLNALAMAERRRRVDRDTRHRLAGLLRELPIRVDLESAALAWTDTAGLAERFAKNIEKFDVPENIRAAGPRPPKK